MRVTEAVPQAVSAIEFLSARGIYEPDVAQIAAANAVLTAAQAVVETASRRMLGVRAVQWHERAWHGQRLWLPVAPVTSVSVVEWSYQGGDFAALPTSEYWLENGFDAPQVVFAAAAVDQIPANAELRISGQAGYADHAPAQLVQAVHLIAGEYFDAGVTDEQYSAPNLSFGAAALVRQVRFVRPAIWGAL
jgi:uncharacterized phiE125 gp8 family phage protein